MRQHTPDAPLGSRDLPDSDTSETRTGDALGTPAYMSPEQSTGQWNQIGPAADIYSLGATLYAILLGQPPSVRRAPRLETSTEVVAVSGKHAIRKASGRVTQSGVPRPLDAVCQKAMAQRPEDRYTTALELAADVERFLADEPVSVDREPFRERARRWAKHHRTAVTSGVVALCVAVVLLGVATMLLKQANRREQVEREKADANFDLAFDAVGRYYTAVSENQLLNIPGLQPMRRRLLEDAQAYYADFIERRGNDPELRYHCAESLRRLARITAETESRHEAERQLRQAEAIFQTLQNEAPGDLRSRIGMASTKSALAWLAYQDGRSSEAGIGFHNAIELWDILVAERPDDDASHAHLAKSLQFAGLVHSQTGQESLARDELTRAMEIREALAAKRKDDNSLADLADSYSQMARLDAESSRSDAAAALFAKVLPIWEDLNRRNPDVIRFSTALANARLSLGIVWRGLGKRDNALTLLLQAAQDREKLAHANPAVKQFQVEWLQALGHLGLSYDPSEKDKARDALKKAQSIGEDLVKKYPDDPHCAALLRECIKSLAALD